jgi:hypothetical protein
MADQLLDPIFPVTPVATATPYTLLDGKGNLCDGTAGTVPVGPAQNTGAASVAGLPLRGLLAGTFKVMMAGAIKAGQRVYSAAAGKASSQSTGVFLGRAREAATALGDIIEVWPPAARVRNLWDILVASALITNVAVETAFSNGVAALLADEFQPGDTYQISALVFCVGENATNTHRIKFKLGTTVLLDTGAIQMAANDWVRINFTLFVRSDGAGGTVIGDGAFSQSLAGTVTGGGANLVSTAVDTTAAPIISVTATPSVANAANQVRLDRFTITRTNEG